MPLIDPRNPRSSVIRAAASMRSRIENAQVFRSIVLSIPVYVVHLLVLPKGAPDYLFHNVAMLKHTAPADRDADVTSPRVGNVGPFGSVGAWPTTEFPRRKATHWNEKAFSAGLAIYRNLRKIMRRLSKDRRETLRLTRFPMPMRLAAIGAKLRVPPSYSVWSCGKFCSALNALTRD